MSSRCLDQLSLTVRTMKRRGGGEGRGWGGRDNEGNMRDGMKRRRKRKELSQTSNSDPP